MLESDIDLLTAKAREVGDNITIDDLFEVYENLSPSGQLKFRECLEQVLAR